MDVNLEKNGRPGVSKLLKPFGVLRGTSQVESNSIDTSGSKIVVNFLNFFLRFSLYVGLRVCHKLPLAG